MGVLLGCVYVLSCGVAIIRVARCLWWFVFGTFLAWFSFLVVCFVVLDFSDLLFVFGCFEFCVLV